MNSSFFVQNRQHLYDHLEDQSLLILFAGSAPQKSADEAYKFVPNRHFYYLTGINEQNIYVSREEDE